MHLIEPKRAALPRALLFTKKATAAARGAILPTCFSIGIRLGPSHSLVLYAMAAPIEEPKKLTPAEVRHCSIYVDRTVARSSRSPTPFFLFQSLPL